ncbi:MAG TPA: TetR/AcrR family transcriptional regulator [Ktedonobacterales bacterium]|nr:TetR/AcrR family transcriptional regulator [Ktedonobacterales bacterium]
MLYDVNDGGSGRTNQKTRTRMAIIDACRALIQTGATVTMPDVAQRALVSEATAYRYFPDIVSLMNEALPGLWPSPNEALGSIAASADPVERIAVTSEFFLRRIIAYQGAVRTMIAATITRPESATLRPGLRFAWIAYALAPVEAMLAPADADAFVRLKRDLAVVVSPEALFTLTDLCGLSPGDAVVNLVRLATTITAAALNRAEV